MNKQMLAVAIIFCMFLMSFDMQRRLEANELEDMEPSYNKIDREEKELFLTAVRGDQVWNQFNLIKEKPNTDESLIQKANALAPLLIRLSALNSKLLLEDLQKDNEKRVDPKKFGEILFETSLFYIHHVDRVAYQDLNDRKRKVFIDALGLEVRRTLSRVYGKVIEETEFHSLFIDVLNKRQIEYGKYQWFPEKDEPLGGSLFWEFGKKIAKVLGFERDLEIILQEQSIIGSSLEQLDLEHLF